MIILIIRFANSFTKQQYNVTKYNKSLVTEPSNSSNLLSLINLIIHQYFVNNALYRHNI